jgi:signal transduction histidine kinase
MKLFPLTAAVALALCSLTGQAATREEANAMLKAALGEIKAKGLQRAGQDFSTDTNTWNKGTLYVFVADFKATVVAHSANNKLIGKNLWEVKDANGKFFLQEQVKQMQAGANGTVTMRWMNPSTKQLDDAEAVLGRVPGQDYYVGAVWFK